MRSKWDFSFKSLAIVGFSLLMILTVTWLVSGGIALAQCWNDKQFTQEFYLDDCGGFSNNTDSNPYFILIPGHQLVLEGKKKKEEIRVEITVLDETYSVDGVETRVVEEREWVDDDLVEISRNYFAICKRTNDVIYFGELSHQCEEGFNNDDTCDDGNFDGSWEAGVNDALPGIIMPGTFLLGSKYFQEIAEEDGAVDRGENVEMGLEWGDFTDCVKVVDTNPAERVCNRMRGDVKIYCPEIGLVQDEELELVVDD